QHEGMDFERFCEAQLVWDTAMATNADAYAKQHPDRTVVIMAGSGHARKQGIPTQLKKLHAPPFVVILPQIEGEFDRKTLTTEEADFIFLFD
ncbi:MAG: ChaN family lipoprotein, partial [Desulfosarcinaceae bacterium]